MAWGVQQSTWTSNNRYPGIFRTVQSRVAEKLGPDLGQAELKMLSFGCSNGSEISTLRGYFPEALLFGCDINPSALRAASESLSMDEATLFESSPAKLREHGPFDVIFAMSVLCRFPESLERERLQLADLYSFGEFERTIEVLSGLLRAGGLFCLFNAHYNFLQSQAAGSYRVVSSPLIASNGFVDKFDSGGGRVTWCEKVGPHYVHRVRRSPDLSDRADFVNCVFEKAEGGGGAIAVPVHRAVAGTARSPDLYRFGPDLDELAARDLVGTALGYWFDAGERGRQVVRAWHRTTPDGRIERHGQWVVRADGMARTALAAPPPTLLAPPSSGAEGRTTPLAGARRLGRWIRDRLTRPATTRRRGQEAPS
jgi:hypothetical protein